MCCGAGVSDGATAAVTVAIGALEETECTGTSSFSTNSFNYTAAEKGETRLSAPFVGLCVD